MSTFPLTSGPNNNVNTAALLAGINPQQLLFGNSALTTNNNLNGLLSILQTSSATGFSPDTFNFGNNSLFGSTIPNTGGINTPNILLGTGGTSVPSPNPITSTSVINTTAIPNPLPITDGTNTAITPNPLTGTGGTSGTTAPPFVQTGITSPPLSSTVIPPTTSMLGSSSLLSNLGLAGTSGTTGGLSQILGMLVQMLTTLGPAVAQATPPAADPALARIEAELKDLKDENAQLRKDNQDLRDRLDGKDNENNNNNNTNNNTNNNPPPAADTRPTEITDVSDNPLPSGISLKTIRDWAHASDQSVTQQTPITKDVIQKALAYVNKRHGALIADPSKNYLGNPTNTTDPNIAFNQEFFGASGDNSDKYAQLNGYLGSLLDRIK